MSEWSPRCLRQLALSFGAAALLGIAPYTASAAGAGGWLEVPLESLRGRMLADVDVRGTGKGLELEVEHGASVVLPFAGAREVAIDYVADVPMLLTYGSWGASGAILHGPFWRHRPLRAGAGTLTVDLRETAGWNESTRPLLRIEGAGRLVITGLRMRAGPSDAKAARAEADRAWFWSREPLGHTTINTLSPPLYSVSSQTYLLDLLGPGLGVLFVAALLALRAARGRWRPGAALAVAAAVVVAASGAHFLVRFIPSANLGLEPDREARIRENYAFPAQFGPLAALARETLSEGDRVGVTGSPGDWFGPQTICFNLAPRPCVILPLGAEEGAGISGVGRMRLADLDAIVSMGAPVPPPGFQVVAAVSRLAFVARRP